MSNDRTQIVRQSTVEVGTELNQTYRIDELIAAGGMGEVFKGHNIQTGDPVAIKVVLPEFARDEMIFELFRKEARVLNHLSHDAIVRYYVFSLDRATGRPYLAMEFVDGPSLAAHMKFATLSVSDFFDLLWRLADGLHKAHNAGVIHRDISPDNIILSGGLVENAKIIDFGIARSASVGGATLLGGSFAGKYNYVSPEQLGLFGGEVTPKSDIYSLGLTMAAAVRGQAIDMSGSQVDVIEKRRVVPNLNAAGIPKPVQSILDVMLQPDPANRPTSMADVLDLVAKAREEVKAKPKEPKPAKVKNVSKPAIASSSSSYPMQGSNTLRNVVLAIGFVAVVVVGGLGGWIYVQSQKNARSTLVATEETRTVNTTPDSKPVLSVPATQPLNASAETTSGAKPESKKGDTPLEAPRQADASPVATPQSQPSVAPIPPTKPDVTEQPAATPATSKPKVDVASLQRFTASYGANKCFRANPVSMSESAAKFNAFGTDAERNKFEQEFVQQAGFTPEIAFNPVTTDQCSFIIGLNQLAEISKSSLELRVDRGEVRGSQADQSLIGDALNVSVNRVGDRNIYLYVVDYAGGVQNINRACPNCITTNADVTTASLSLSAPDGNDGMIGDFAPVIVFVAAASKPLNAINSKDAFDSDDFVKALLQDAAASPDFASGLGYVKLKK